MLFHENRMEIQNQSFATHLNCRWHTTARLSIECLQPLVNGLALYTIGNTLTMSHSGVLPTANHVQSIFHVLFFILGIHLCVLTLRWRIKYDPVHKISPLRVFDVSVHLFSRCA